MRINHNLPALNTYRQLTANQAAGVKSTEKLSSGLRINRAGDDAAGLAISEKMRGQIRGLDQASRNGQDAISMIQTSEGALNETHDILQRMRELAVQASTDTNAGGDRAEIQKEINQLTSEINRIGNTTEFNTQKLLNGDKSNSAISSTGRGFVGLSGAIASAATALTVGSGSLSLLQAGANKLGEGDYKVVITAASTSATVAGTYSGVTTSGGVTTYTLASGSISATGTITPTKADVTISGTAANFGNNNQIRFDRSALNIDPNTVGKFSLTMGASGAMTVSFTASGTVTAPSGVVITDIIYANASGNFSYDNYGINFSGNVGAMAIGDKISYTLASGTGVTNAGTLQQYWTGINVSGATAPGSTINLSGADQGAYKIEIISATSGGSGTIRVTMSGATGVQTVLGTFSGVAFTVGSTADFTFSGHGINFTMSGLNNFSGGTTNTIQFSTLLSGSTSAVVTTSGNNPDVITTTYTYNAQLQNASGVVIDSGSLGTATTVVTGSTTTVNGLTAAYSGDIGGVHLHFSGGVTVSSGTTNFTVGAIIENVAKSGESSLNFQIGANENQSMSLEISDMRANALGITRSLDAGTHAGFTAATAVTNGTNNTNTEYAIDVSSAANASNALTVIQSAIDKVSSERSKLGAYQNRLEHTINNLGTSSENLTASESRIRDVDMAKEMMANTRNNILQQAAQAMLAQANQAPQQVLQLLR